MAGSVTVKGNQITFTGTSENFPIRNAAGEVDATMFTFSYERSDNAGKSDRPVLFAWNGGPACGSLFVHMGLLSPMRVKCGEGPDMPQTAPFELMNNDNCLLDTCDVVSVDAIGTGYARLLNQESKDKYCSTACDAEAFALCIRLWLTEHRRWNSPVYIMGESYGTIRTAMVADALFYNAGIDGAGSPLHVSGIINLGSALNYGQESFPIPDAVLNLPSIAAAHWYWHPEDKGSLEEFVDECDRFCYGEYVQALALGKRLPEAEQKVIAEKLNCYTGYPVDKLLEDGLIVDIFKYPVEGLREEGRSIGIYDARFALGKFGDPQKYDFFSDDASNAISMPAFSVAFNGIWKEALQIDTDEDYIEIWNGAMEKWDFKTKTSPMECLEKAMHRNPKLKVMFGIGYYDMLTTLGWVRYLVSHYNYPEDRLYLNYYKAGHMPYLGDSQAMQLQEDIKAFIRR
jgi:carboxypeptidase C (cathepsin A)